MFAIPKILNICTVFLICLPILLHANCVLEVPTDTKQIPLYEKNFGSRKLKFPIMSNKIFIDENEKFNAFCTTSFKGFSYDVTNSYQEQNYPYKWQHETIEEWPALERRITLTCQSDGIYYEDHKIKQNLLACNDMTWSLYEAESTESLCMKDTFASYVIASDSKENNETLAHLCWDIEEMSLKTISYSYSSNLKSLSDTVYHFETTNFEEISIGALVSHFSSMFTNEATIESDYHHNSLMQYWFRLATFEYHPIVQSKNFLKHFHKFDSLLNIVWWKNLRLGNWQHFTNALETHLETTPMSYHVVAGTFGAVKVQHKSKCGKEHILDLQLPQTNKFIPAYIWNYIRSNNGSDKFVFVSYNSPFTEFFNKSDIIFCQNICDRITWLNHTRHSFDYSIMGLSFCCSVEQVRQKNLIDNFPAEFIMSETTSSVRYFSTSENTTVDDTENNTPLIPFKNSNFNNEITENVIPL